LCASTAVLINAQDLGSKQPALEFETGTLAGDAFAAASGLTRTAVFNCGTVGTHARGGHARLLETALPWMVIDGRYQISKRPVNRRTSEPCGYPTLEPAADAAAFTSGMHLFD